jgi:hypothetical protein
LIFFESYALACSKTASPAGSFAGDDHDQSTKGSCDAQEKLETRQGERQASAQEGGEAQAAG